MSVRIRSGLAGVVPAALCAAIVAVFGVGVSSALAAGDANEAFCPQETEASPGFREYLPDCRAYELVTPPLKGGFPFADGSPGAFLVSPDGSRALTVSYGGLADVEDIEDVGRGSFDGAVYGLSRDDGGWQVQSLGPSLAYIHEQGYEQNTFWGASVDLTRTLWNVYSSEISGSSGPRSVSKLFVGEPGGGFEEVGPVDPASVLTGGESLSVSAVGASANLGTVVTAVSDKHALSLQGAGTLWPGDGTLENDFSLYMYTGVHNVEPKLVGVNDTGKQISQCGTWLGSSESESTYDAVSDEGRAVFFTADAADQGASKEYCNSSDEGTGPRVGELYVRVDGDRTVAISEPGRGVAGCDDVCEGTASGSEEGVFEGASSEPSGPNHVVKVFFTTTQPLLNEDEDTTDDLYEAEVALGEPGSETAHLEKLVMVSHGEAGTLGGAATADGNGADVLGVARISPDGSHVYFVAEGILTDTENSEEEHAEEDEPNLYVYDSENGRTSFVATLEPPLEEKELEEALEVCSGLHGHVKSECETPFYESFYVNENDWYTADDPVQTTPDGQYLLFPSNSDLTSDDTSGVFAEQLFEYDAEDGKLARVSVGQKGSYECPVTKTVEAGFNCDGNTAVTVDAPQTRIEPVAPFTSSFPAGQAMNREAERELAENGDVFFESEDKLTEQALEGTKTPTGKAYNVYEYSSRNENVYMLSDGKDDQIVYEPEQSPATRLFGVSLTGSSVFLQTADQLVPQDRDTQVDVYDAHIEGGFPAPVAPESCGEDCQPAGPSQPLLSSPTSTSYSGGTNVSAPVTSTKKAKTKRTVSRAQKLARALKACRAKRGKRKRSKCEAQAHGKYGKKKRKKAKRSSVRGDM